MAIISKEQKLQKLDKYSYGKEKTGNSYLVNHAMDLEG